MSMNPADPRSVPAHADEAHTATTSSKLNWLRAGVLGANDGIVSVAALLVGVAAASSELGPVVVAGVAALVAGAISMALGEYVSVSTQRDTEKALIALESHELATMPEEELEELTRIYEGKGLTRDTAERVAAELTAHDALGAHLEAELHMGEEDLTNPWHAAGASALAFVIGGILPLVALLAVPAELRIIAVFVVVLLALVLTGWTSARLGGSPRGPAILRIVVGGALALAATTLIGSLFGVAGV